MVADEVVQADAERSVRSHAHLAVARSSDKVNNRVHGSLSASTVKSWVTTRVTAAIAQAIAMVKVKGALEIGGSADLRAALIRTSSTGCRPSALHPSKRSSKRKVMLLKLQATQANCISSSEVSGLAKPSALHQSRKLLAVPGVINGLQCPGLLVYCGSPVTLIRADMWEQLRQPHNKLLIEQEKFQGVTRDGLRVFGLAYLKLEFGSLHIEHPVVVVDKIAHKFILGNDFLIQYQCDILNSDGVIVFVKKSVPYTLFRSTINLICPVICQSRTEIEPYKEAVIPGLLDSYRHYNPD